MSDTTVVPSRNIRLWYAKGFTARMKHPDYPNSPAGPLSRRPAPKVDFKGDRHREQTFREGWAWANALLQSNRVPYDLGEVKALENRVWNEARGLVKARG